MRINPPTQYPQKRLIVFAGANTIRRVVPLQACQVEALMGSYAYVKESNVEKNSALMAVLDTWAQYRYLDSGVFTFLREAGATMLGKGQPPAQQKYQKDYKAICTAAKDDRICHPTELATRLGIPKDRVRAILRKLELAKRVERKKEGKEEAFEWVAVSEDCDLHIEALTEHIASYLDYITGPGIGWDFIFDIDVDNLVIGNSTGNSVKGIEVADYCRRLLKEAVGDRLIPVWHHESDTEGYPRFKQMLSTHKYIAIGSDISSTSRELRYLCDMAHQAGVLVHGLGTSKADVLNIMPFDTTDSTTWLAVARFGHAGPLTLTVKQVVKPRDMAKMREATTKAKTQGYAASRLFTTTKEGMYARMEVAVKCLQERQEAAQNPGFVSIYRPHLLDSSHIEGAQNDR